MTTNITIEKKKTTLKQIKAPGKYKVIICNDDVTPVDFVISMLVMVFNHSESHAVQLTQLVHHQGSAVAGIYSYEIAEQKGLDATDLARENDFPLIIKITAE